MNEEQLRQELRKLEKRILRITGDPLKFNRRFYLWSNNKKAVERVRELMSDRSYILGILFEKHCTPSEVERLERINDLLLEMTNRTYRRTADLARRVLATIKDPLDDDYEIEGILMPEFALPYSVLRLEDDAYYGSDFVRMATILQETEEYQPPIAHAHCYPDQIRNYTPAITDKELGCENEMDNGTSWAESWLRNPKFGDICVCYALHVLVTDMNWSIPDVLRINDFKIEVTYKVRQFSDQERNRLWWWNRCDLTRFKEVLLHEAMSRPKALPLETFLLQRCRDYFEESADEALVDVGIDSIDNYLDALYNIIKRKGV